MEKWLKPFMVVLRPDSVLVLILILAAALAGCLGGDGAEADESDDPGPGGGGGGGEKKEPAPEDGEGDLKGMVLDDGFSPVSGASVRLTQDGDTVEHTSTGADGQFEFKEVPAGRYRLEGSASCCRDKTERVTVKADDVVVQDLRLERQSGEDRQRPFVADDEWDGFIACGVAVMGERQAPCTLDENQAVEHRWNVTQGLRTLYVYVEWDAQPTGEELHVEVTRGEDHVFKEDEGASPLHLRIDNDEIEQPALQWENIEDKMELTVNVLPGGDVGVFYQMDFKVILLEFHWRPAPEGFEFVMPE